MVHRDDPGQPCVSPSGNEWAYMYIRRTNSAILEATAETLLPGHTRLSAASSPRGCWVSVYDASYISAGPVNYGSITIPSG
jgi:hypothetical protein